LNLRLASALLLAAVSSVCLAQRPVVAKMLDKPGVTIGLESIVFDAGISQQPGDPATGTGDFVVSSLGTSYKSQAARFTELRQNAEGAALAGRVQLTQPLDVEDFVGSTIDLVAPANTVILFQADSSLRITAPTGGRVELGLPVRIDDGTFARLASTDFVIASTAGGCKITLANATVLTPSATKTFDLGPVGLKSTGLADLVVNVANSEVSDWKLTLKQGTASLALDGLLTDTSKPLTVNVTNAQVDQDGQVSFEQAALAGPQVLKPAGLAGFEITVKQASVTMQNGQPVAANLVCDVLFPTDFKDSAGQRYRLTDLRANTAQNEGVVLEMVGQAPPMKWREISLTDLSGLALDLSTKRKPASVPNTVDNFVKDNAFVGLFVATGKIQLPETFLAASGDRVSVAVSNLAIESAGPTGSISLDGAAIQEIAGFGARDIAGSAKLTRGKFTSCTASAFLEVPLNGGGTGTTPGVKTKITFNDEGYVLVNIEPNDLPIEALGCKLNVQRGRLLIEPNKPAKVFVTGDLQFNVTPQMMVAPLPPELLGAVNGARLRVQDIGFDADGNVYLPTSGTLNLGQPVVIDLKVVKIEGRSIGFETQNNKLTGVTIGGGVELGEELGLPFSGGLDFGGLRIAKSNNPSKPIDMGLKELGIDLNINNALSVSGRLAFENRADFGNVFHGRAKLAISELPGFDIVFALGQRGWFVGGGGIIPTVTINIPTTGGPVPVMNIYGAYGGIGMNVEQKDPSEGRITSIDQMNCVQGQNLAQIGLIIGDQFTGNLWWGQTTVTLGFPALTIALAGQFSFLDTKTPDLVDNSYWDQADRVATVFASLDLSDLPNDLSFTVGGDTFLSVMERDNYLVALEGEFQMKLSKDEKYLRVGWEPAGQTPVRFSLGPGLPPNVKFTLKGGYELNLQNRTFGLDLDGKVEGDFGIQAEGTLVGRVRASLPESATGKFPLPSASGTLSFDGKASFPAFPDLSASCFARLNAELKPVSQKLRLTANGDVEAVVRVFGKRVSVEGRFDAILLEMK
jgi:hypothetical protein